MYRPALRTSYGFMLDGFYSLGFILSTFMVWRDHTIARDIINSLANEENQ